MYSTTSLIPGPAAQDVVMVADNPAYEQVTVQRFELKENTAYQIAYPAAISHDYEELPQFGVMNQQRRYSREGVCPDHENVNMSDQ